MFDPDVFAAEMPLSNEERRARWYLKKWMHKAEDWWRLTHPGEDGLIADDALGDLIDVPAFLRRQAE